MNGKVTRYLFSYAVRESTSRVKIFRNFRERAGLLPKLNYAAEGIFGGTLLGVRSNGFLNFYDWETGAVVRRIDVDAKNVSRILIHLKRCTTDHDLFRFSGLMQEISLLSFARTLSTSFDTTHKLTPNLLRMAVIQVSKVSKRLLSLRMMSLKGS